MSGLAKGLCAFVMLALAPAAIDAESPAPSAKKELPGSGWDPFANCKGPKTSAHGTIGQGASAIVNAVKNWEAKVKVTHGPDYAHFSRGAQRAFVCNGGIVKTQCTATALPCK